MAAAAARLGDFDRAILQGKAIRIRKERSTALATIAVEAIAAGKASLAVTLTDELVMASDVERVVLSIWATGDHDTAFRCWHKRGAGSIGSPCLGYWPM